MQLKRTRKPVKVTSEDESESSHEVQGDCKSYINSHLAIVDLHEVCRALKVGVVGWLIKREARLPAAGG